MDSKCIIMSQREIKRYDIIKRVINKELDGTEAAELLNLSARQIRRLKKRVKDKGAQGLVHKNRGRTSNRKMPDHERQKIAGLIKEHYSDFGPLLASEKLWERHKIKRNKGTIRNIMMEESIWKSKTKKKEKHRAWRQRKASFGEMVQYDGSYEYWFEDRGDKCCLLASIDDANSKAWMKFDKHEGVEPTFSFWREYIQAFGKPYSVYVDKFSTYSMNHKLAKENPDTLTQFQRAMETDLNIEIIHAGSAQAKGRIEKLFKTLQDRLVKELRLNDISTITEANKFLEEDFLPRFNAKFMVEPRTKADLHKKLTEQEANRLDSVFSRQYRRTVRNDFTISYGKNWYQLTEDQPATICKKDKIIAEERMDKSIYFKLRGKYLNYKLLPSRPEKINQKTKWVIAQSSNRKPRIPSANHPWRRFQYSNKLIQMSK